MCLRGNIVGIFSEKKSKIWGATTTPLIVPSAKIKKKTPLALELQGFEARQISATFRRLFGDFLEIFWEKYEKDCIECTVMLL